MNNRFCNFFRSFCPRRGVGNDDLRQPFLDHVAINGSAIPEEKFPVQVRVKTLPKEPLRLQQKRKNLQLIKKALRILKNPTNCNSLFPISLLFLVGAGAAAIAYLSYYAFQYSNLGDDAFAKYNVTLIPGQNKTCGMLDSENGSDCIPNLAENTTFPAYCVEALNTICVGANWNVVGTVGGVFLGILDVIALFGAIGITMNRCKETFLPRDLPNYQFAPVSAAARSAGFVIDDKTFSQVIDHLKEARKKLQRSIENDIYYRRLDFVGGIYRDPESKIAVSEDELQLLSPEIVKEIFAFAKLNEPNELQAIRVDDLEPDEEKYSAAAAGMGM